MRFNLGGRGIVQLGLGCCTAIVAATACGDTQSGGGVTACEGGTDASTGNESVAGADDADIAGADSGVGATARSGGGGRGRGRGETTADGGMAPQPRTDGGAGGQPLAEAGVGGAGGETGAGEAGAGPTILGGPFPGSPPAIEVGDTYALGYYQDYQNVGLLCVWNPGADPFCAQYGSAGSRPYVLNGPGPCGTHGRQATEFAGFGTVVNTYWYSSLNDFYWQPGLDDKYTGQQGTAPWPVVWNGVLTSFELGKFTVDWQGHWWQTTAGVVELPFAPEGLDANAPVLPVVGRWRREYGQRLGLYNAGKFYLDWDGDNAWNPETDKIGQLGTAAMYPVAADFAPGGADELALYADGVWYVDLNGNLAWDGPDGGDQEILFGLAGTLPVVSRNLWLRHCNVP